MSALDRPLDLLGIDIIDIGPGQEDLTCAAAPGRARHLRYAAGIRHDTEYEGQAQPGALAHFLGGEEGLEDVRERGLIHAGAGVRDDELDVASRRERGLGDGELPL